MTVSLALVAMTTCCYQQDLAVAVGTAYRANREALSHHGAIVFEESYGRLRAGQLDELARLDWTRGLPLEDGFYAYDGRNAVARHVYSLDVLMKARTRIDEARSSYVLFGWRALTDGETTLYDDVSVAYPDVSPRLLHTTVMRNGYKDFYRNHEIGLNPGNPEPQSFQPPDLGATLGGTAVGAAFRLDRVDADAEIEGQPVVRLEFLVGTEGRMWFWVDLERGAVPLRIRSFAVEPGQQAIQHDFGDLRWVGRAWYPFRSQVAVIENVDGDGRYERGFLREKIITRADFEHKPDPAVFKLTFPEPMVVRNPDTMVQYPLSDVWDLESIGRSAAARAKPLKVAATGANATAPIMPGSRPARAWTRFAMWVAGAVLIVAGGMLLRRRRHAAA